MGGAPPHVGLARAVRRALRSEARKGRMLPLVIELDGKFCGQLTVGNVVRGALRSAWIGYWVARDVGGGVATARAGARPRPLLRPGGAAPGGGHRAAGEPGQPGGAAQCRFPRGGPAASATSTSTAQWRDHLLVGMTVEEVPGTVADSLVRSGKATWA